jgi:hypothetical protein
MIEKAFNGDAIYVQQSISKTVFRNLRLKLIFVERSSTNECSHHPPPRTNLETNAKFYESVHITECEAHMRCYIFHNFRFLTFSQF